MRVAIIINNKLNRGGAANVCAILMGQLVIKCPTLYSHEFIFDKTGYIHSGVKFSTIILRGQENEIMDFCLNLSNNKLLQELNAIIFTREGQQLNDEFHEYKKAVQSKQLIDLHPLGIIIAGNMNCVKELTRNFYLY